MMPFRMVDSPTGIVVLDGQGLPVADIVRPADGAARPVPGSEAMKLADRPLTDDVTGAAALLDRFTDLMRGMA
ncbi:hypothetical protein HRW18_17115 [Streptomyces lunaelactis]|uniref:hypothetical protein n=2 Tax=Streptomyces lunaelactis TaxID=1535768 RepID=UPI0015856B35|nr:hypothetical protein [Streptomyces lunaelactis]NUK09696.1 hypothetical protein [Streptomyces lunaelactis]NUK26677.1 hypothetical protein [Streptomyces lunaelactis]NUK34651.1 hypothetical protein [Streptomyces lunaelactis]NUK41410.1 hypothetical protein [Streptomyces lunaelactis]NUK91769.1 hypothetical protein [Streptomyces lunaelactis]